ncbi:hypothetical protein VaNZ11_005205 [Volvox africanus]|uniref:Uncharacterized protein n=1 Tax=Volvox africanus TaxID=51714 RepID=A0ABQ5RZV5_9CHLO|nr:hypothetical protein VaNZ11_005205 [Volvox africanus]
MGVDGPSSELGPLVQALQRRRAATSNQDQQAYAMGKFMAPPLLPSTPNRKPLSDCNMAAKRVLGPNARSPNEHFIPPPGAIDRQNQTCVGGAVQHRNCPEIDQCRSPSGREQYPGVRRFEHRQEHRLSNVTDSEYRPSSAAGVETRMNATGFGKRPSATENSGVRGNGSIFNQRPSAPAGCDPRPSSGSFEKQPKMMGFEPRPRPAASAEQRLNAMANSGQRPAPVVSFDTRPGAGAPFEQSPSQGELEPHPNNAGSTGKRPGVPAAFDPHHNGAAVFQPRPSSAAAVKPRPSAASEFGLNTNASVGPQSNPAQGSEPSLLVSTRSLQTPKPANVQPQKPYANLAAHPQHQQQQVSKVQQQQGSYQADLQRRSTSSHERSSVGHLTAAATNFASSQRRPSAGAADTLHASTDALPPTSEKTPEHTSNITGVKGMTTTVAMKARNSIDSIGWMEMCAEGRAEADRKRGLTLPNDHKSELKQWLYHDIMQRQGHPLHVPKNIGF